MPDTITRAKIARDTGLNDSQVAAWITHAESYADGSGYRLFFRVETPRDVLDLIPPLTPEYVLSIQST